MSESTFGGGGLIVAHRGASAVTAENTLAAFEAAIAAGADAVEFDVRMTADDAAVVMHDPDVARTTDGTGLVREMTLRDLKRLRIPLPGGGETEVPLLDEVLRICSDRVGIDVEIKNIPGEPDFDPERERAVEATIRALDDVAFSGAVFLSSFNPFSIARSRALDASIPTGLLTDPTVDADVAVTFASEQGHAWALPFIDRVEEAGPTGLVERARARDMQVGTWITDDPGRIVRLLAAGVDAVATNDPEAAVAARRAGGPA